MTDTNLLAGLTVQELHDVAAFAADADPAVELVDADTEDTDAPHGQNTADEMDGAGQ